MTTQEKQRLVNEWHRQAKARDRAQDADDIQTSSDCEYRMAGIESKLHLEGVNPAAWEPDLSTPEPAKLRAPTIDPEFAKTLSEQDRRNLEHWLQSK